MRLKKLSFLYYANSHLSVFVRFGRKKSTIAHMILGGIACFIVSLIPGGTGRTGKHEQALRWCWPQYIPCPILEPARVLSSEAYFSANLNLKEYLNKVFGAEH